MESWMKKSQMSMYIKIAGVTFLTHLVSLIYQWEKKIEAKVLKALQLFALQLKNVLIGNQIAFCVAKV